MKRLLIIGMTSLAALAVLFGAFHFMRAQGRASWKTKKFSPAAQAAKTDTPSKPVQYELARTFFTQAYYDGEGPDIEADTTTALDSPNTFYCWLPCTLEVDAKPEVWAGADETGSWLWVDEYIDGQATGDFVPVAEVPEDGSVVVGPFDWTYNLQPGLHTVQTYILVDDGAELVGWHNNYRIYYCIH